MLARCVYLILTLSLLGVTACSAPPSSPPPSKQAASPAASMPSVAPHSAVGAMAPLMPPELTVLPGDSRILTSSAAPEESALIVSITISSLLSVHDLEVFYHSVLTPMGFAPVPTPTPSGLQAIQSYTRTPTNTDVIESIIVAILDDGDHRTVSISGEIFPVSNEP